MTLLNLGGQAAFHAVAASAGEVVYRANTLSWVLRVRTEAEGPFEVSQIRGASQVLGCTQSGTPSGEGTSGGRSEVVKS